LYHPLVDLPPLAPPPAIRNGYITFGSFNRIAKIGRTAIAAWARVLQAVPRSRLIIKSSVGLSPDAAVRYQTAFREYGISADRLEFRGRVSGDVDHFRQFNDIDIALDTLPFCGVLTTCAASAMGVPVVTCAGARILERYGAAILGAIGFDEGVATGVDDYVAKAISLASDPGRLAALRRALRDQLLASPVCDAPAFAHSVESAYRAMWRRWCRDVGRA
jgi:predicted O-linked N-acetylglucosamine transferase (SPINDLY family)